MKSFLSSWDTYLHGPSVRIGVNEVEMCILFGPISFLSSPSPWSCFFAFIYMAVLLLHFDL